MKNWVNNYHDINDIMTINHGKEKEVEKICLQHKNISKVKLW